MISFSYVLMMKSLMTLSCSFLQLSVLIIGPFDTPYEGGFFQFLLRFPPNYPFSPPRVKFLTTGDGTVRFNPNLYRNGKVCLSTLGYEERLITA